MSATGGSGFFYSRALINDVTMAQGRSVIAGTNAGHIKLPTGDNPAQLPIGVSTDGNASGVAESVLIMGEAMIELGGNATYGKLQYVKNTGTHADIVTNATPVAQTCIGQAMEAGASADLILALVRPMFVVA